MGPMKKLPPCTSKCLRNQLFRSNLKLARLKWGGEVTALQIQSLKTHTDHLKFNHSGAVESEDGPAATGPANWILRIMTRFARR
jgi:hypothetical protein